MPVPHSCYSRGVRRGQGKGKEVLGLLGGIVNFRVPEVEGDGGDHHGVCGVGGEGRLFGTVGNEQDIASWHCYITTGPA